MNEPYNVVENVLTDDEKVYKALGPSIDLSINELQPCFISMVVIYPGDTGPQNIEIYLSNEENNWKLVKQVTANKAPVHNIVIPGENLAKYIRIKCINNIRGGNFVNIRFIQVKGLHPD